MLDRPNRTHSARVMALVDQIRGQTPPVKQIAVDASLTDGGFTSVDMVNLMLAVEAEFDIMIPPSDITPENFRSVATIHALVARLTD